MGGGYATYNIRGYSGSHISICYRLPNSTTAIYDSDAYILLYDSNYLYVATNYHVAYDDVKILEISTSQHYFIYPRVLVEYDESDNIIWRSCRVTDNNLIDNLIDMQPACWQQYIDRNNKSFAVFAFPLK